MLIQCDCGRCQCQACNVELAHELEERGLLRPGGAAELLGIIHDAEESGHTWGLPDKPGCLASWLTAPTTDHRLRTLTVH
jgi:hypothetical protein